MEVGELMKVLVLEVEVGNETGTMTELLKIQKSPLSLGPEPLTFLWIQSHFDVKHDNLESKRRYSVQ